MWYLRTAPTVLLEPVIIDRCKSGDLKSLRTFILQILAPIVCLQWTTEPLSERVWSAHILDRSADLNGGVGRPSALTSANCTLLEVDRLNRRFGKCAHRMQQGACPVPVADDTRNWLKGSQLVMTWVYIPGSNAGAAAATAAWGWDTTVKRRNNAQSSKSTRMPNEILVGSLILSSEKLNLLFSFRRVSDHKLVHNCMCHHPSEYVRCRKIICHMVPTQSIVSSKRASCAASIVGP